MRLRNDGWALEYTGTYSSAEAIAKALWPGIKDTKTVFSISAGTGKCGFYSPTHILVVAEPCQWVCWFADDLRICMSVPDDWKETESQFTKNVMFDWFNNVR